MQSFTTGIHVHSWQYTAQYKLYSVQCTGQIVRSLHSTNCRVQIVQCTLHSKNCTMFTAQYKLFTVHCTVKSVCSVRCLCVNVSVAQGEGGDDTNQDTHEGGFRRRPSTPRYGICPAPLGMGPSTPRYGAQNP